MLPPLPPCPFQQDEVSQPNMVVGETMFVLMSGFTKERREISLTWHQKQLQGRCSLLPGGVVKGMY